MCRRFNEVTNRKYFLFQQTMLFFPESKINFVEKCPSTKDMDLCYNELYQKRCDDAKSKFVAKSKQIFDLFWKYS